MIDITDRKRAETVLLETQRRLDSALIAGEVGTFQWDVVDDRLAGDQNFARMFNVELDADGAAPLERSRDVDAHVLGVCAEADVLTASLLHHKLTSVTAYVILHFGLPL